MSFPKFSLIDFITDEAKEKSKLFSLLFDGTGKSKNFVAPFLMLASIVFKIVEAVSTST